VIIDGYNLIYAGAELEALMRENMEAAREKLIAELEEYCFRKELVAEVVFDGAGSKGPATHEQRSQFLKVTFTAEGRSADSYIEKLAYQIGGARTGEALLITGDYHQQKVAAGAGLLRMSSREFLLELEDSRAEAAEERRRSTAGRWHVPLEGRLPDHIRARLERLRRRR
jgi:predicted RNA-binding protein with PIN domain